jgi:signal transduction histidine kinase
MPFPGAPLNRLWPFAAAILAIALQWTGILAPAERPLRDSLVRALPTRPADQVAVVLLDEQALRRHGAWPWTRVQLAQLVLRVAAAGARGVVLDILLPDARDGDQALAGALARVPSVLAVAVGERSAVLQPCPVLRAGTLGHVNFDLDGDGVARHCLATREVDGRMLQAMSLAAARLERGNLAIPVGATLRPGFRNRPIAGLGAAEVLAGVGTERLRGRVVFIGASADGLGDRFITPTSRDGALEPGVQVQAAATQSILAGDLLHRASPLTNGALAMVLAWLAGLAVAAGGRKLLALPVIALAPLAAALGALGGLRLELAPVAVTFAILLPGALLAARAARRTRLAFAGAEGRILELEALRESLPQARREDAEARRVLAHELKTPLTSVRGLAQLLARFELTGPERDRVTGLVVAETTRMARMVDSLLDLERLSVRDFSERARPVDLSRLSQERLELLRVGPDRDWQLELEPDLRVRGDAALLAGILDNLVGNALKFSPAGTPIRVTLEGGPEEVLLEVEDRGPGVPEPERAAIFGRFKRGQAQTAAPGLGLGLALVAEGVAWHGGQVAVDRGRDGGARFRVRLPRLKDSCD